MKKTLLSILCILSPIFCLADSPLTSTTFWKRYEQLPIVQEAVEHGMTPQVTKFLCDSTAVLELRLAVVNSLGWNIEGQSNYYTALDEIRNSVYNWTDDEPVVLDLCSADQVCVLAYLKAMDDYFDVTDALRMARKAMARKPESHAVAMTCALIKAQVLLDEDWCELYRVVAEVGNKQYESKDFSDYAVAQIMEYIGLYECGKDEK